MDTQQQSRISPSDRETLARKIKSWGNEFGFQQTGIAPVGLDTAAEKLREWLSNGMHGEMEYMARHGSKRYTAAELVAGTASVISVRMDYLHRDAAKTPRTSISLKSMATRERQPQPPWLRHRCC